MARRRPSTKIDIDINSTADRLEALIIELEFHLKTMEDEEHDGGREEEAEANGSRPPEVDGPGDARSAG